MEACELSVLQFRAVGDGAKCGGWLFQSSTVNLSLFDANGVGPIDLNG